MKACVLAGALLVLLAAGCSGGKHELTPAELAAQPGCSHAPALRSEYIALSRTLDGAHAIRCLATFDDARSAGAVARPLLVGGSAAKRAAAAEALPKMKLGAPTVVDSLVARSFETGDEQVTNVVVAIGRPAVAPLARRFRSHNFDTQAWAARLLLRLHATELVPKIEAAMLAHIDDIPNQERALDVLADIGRPVTDRLVRLARTPYLSLSEQDKKTYQYATYSLAAIGARNRKAVEPLLRALRRKDLEFIADLHQFYIPLGLGEQELIAALKAHGDSAIGLDFIVSGNPRLDRAARDWASTHGYAVTGARPGPGTWATLKLARS